MKKIISILLVVILCIGIIPLNASAAEERSINFDGVSPDYELVVDNGEVVTVTDSIEIARIRIETKGKLILDGAEITLSGDKDYQFYNKGIIKATENGGSITMTKDGNSSGTIIGVRLSAPYFYNNGVMDLCSFDGGTFTNLKIVGDCDLKGEVLDAYTGCIVGSTVDFEKYYINTKTKWFYSISPQDQPFTPGTIVPLELIPHEDYVDTLVFESWEVTNILDDTVIEVTDSTSPTASFVMPDAPVEIKVNYTFKHSNTLKIMGEEVNEDNLSGDGWSYDPDTQTLTFDDFTYTGNGLYGDGDFGYVVLSNLDKLTVKGNASIDFISDFNEETIGNYVLASNGHIVFDNADIKIKSNCGVGVDSLQNIEIVNNSNFDLNVGYDCFDEGLYSMEDVIIEDSKVKITSLSYDNGYVFDGNDGIVGDDIIITNSDIDINTYNDGFDAREDVVIIDSKVNVRSYWNDDGGYTIGNEGIEASKSIRIYGDSDVRCLADDNALSAPKIYISDGKTVLLSPGTDTAFSAVNGILFYSGGIVEIQAQKSALVYPAMLRKNINWTVLASENFDGSDATADYDYELFTDYKYIQLNSIEGTVDTVKPGTKLSKVGIEGTLSGVKGTFQWENPDEKVEETGKYFALFIPDDANEKPIQISVEVVVCSHICHDESIIARTFWGVLKPIFKLFGIQKDCECGSSHFN